MLPDRQQVVFGTIPEYGKLGGSLVRYALRNGHLFVFYPKAREVVSVQKLYDYPPFGSHIWRSAFLVLHKDGNVYGTDVSKLFKLDPVSKTYTKLVDNASLLVQDREGTLFFRRKADLWSLRVEWSKRRFRFAVFIGIDFSPYGRLR
ncbi:hypothetical protein [Lunatimonas salinarum]|uniref:hypothetical protein n=1 Tax=Lunatimonas salinarum TaxID=1774590 RepID=UPI001ADF5386|nr:hypothetical protein [Lunatimonas salinarum]